MKLENLERLVREMVEGSAPLAAFIRGNCLDGVHCGSLAVVDSADSLVAAIGNDDARANLRSAAKPFQLMAVSASGAVERFGLSDEELAVAAASHSAEPEHLLAVRSMLEKIGLDESHLRCGAHPPFMPHVAARMAATGEAPSPINNNCSGKHAAMLAACLARGWPTEGYEAPGHPLQRENLARLARFAGLEPGDIETAIDGCAVPSFILPLRRTALALARLADHLSAPAQDREPARRVFDIIGAHPSLGSGKLDRLDAALMRTTGGRLIAKVGAEGFYTVAVAPAAVGERGLGVAMKLTEGVTFNRATGPVILEALRQLGVLGDGELEQLGGFYPRRLRNCRDQVVGEVRVLFNLASPPRGIGKRIAAADQ